MITISYFSYKGGSGRSTLCYNTIPFLAKKLNATPQNPLIVLDLDIDSAGLTFLLNSEILNAANSDRLSTQSLIRRGVPGLDESPSFTQLENHPFFSRLEKVGNRLGLVGEENNGSILFVPVKVADAMREEDRRDYNPFTDVKGLCMRYKCAGIVFDTPTGNQICASWALANSSKIATVMRITYQFRKGTALYLKRKAAEFTNKKFIAVPNAVPTEEIRVEGVNYDFNLVKEEISEWLTDSINQNGNTVSLEMLEGDYFGVPEVKSFKLKEGLLYNARYPLTQDEEKAYRMYEKFADIVTEETRNE